jgi:hypothetical protein
MCPASASRETGSRILPSEPRAGARRRVRPIFWDSSTTGGGQRELFPSSLVSTPELGPPSQTASLGLVVRRVQKAPNGCTLGLELGLKAP